jgi:glycosyltransferase involved in cell wall biosynthesis
MTHLIISREYPPAAYTHGGIGTYVQQIADLLATRGETVHVIAEQWDRARRARESFRGGRLIVHRVPLARPRDLRPGERDPPDGAEILEAMAASEFPAQGFSWQAALLAETLVETEGIDLIEGQDYEAPLYYLLLRRAVGLGPARQPPCLVHLHGPWELVCRYNGWGLATPYDFTVARLEAHTIRAADALLCPSDFLASQVAASYGIDRGSIEHIRYPIGDTPRLTRTADTWRGGTILHVGRMEPRKGVLEWIEAAVMMAAERPGLRFEFVGADTTLDGRDGGPSVRDELKRRVPEHLASAFAFHDAEPRSALWSRLANAQLVVIPSRWDNFPNVGVEAMCSGVPVLASPEGGIAEVIDDGRTGWVAASNRPADLLDALRRALDTPPDVRSAMGAAAADLIRHRCDNTATVEHHLAFRQRVIERGASRSSRLPESGTIASVSMRIEPVRSGLGVVGETLPLAGTLRSQAHGVALVVVDADDGGLRRCLADVAAQHRAASTVVIVTGPAGLAATGMSSRAIDESGWQVIDGSHLSVGGRRDAGLHQILTMRSMPGAVALIDGACRLAPEFVEACQRVLERDESVGLFSSWFSCGGPWDRTMIRPAPAWPYQLVADDVASCPAFRLDALRRTTWIRERTNHMPGVADLAAAVLADGWRAVTYPGVLSWRERLDPREALNAAVREALLARVPADGRGDLASLRESDLSWTPGVSGRSARGSFSRHTILRQPARTQASLIGRAIRNPRYAAGWIGWQARRAWSRALQRLRRSSAGRPRG